MSFVFSINWRKWALPLSFEHSPGCFGGMYEINVGPFEILFWRTIETEELSDDATN